MAIDASNSTQKEDLLAKLYSLRAGLSVIAEETGKIKQAETEIADLSRKNEENNEKVNQESAAISEGYNRQIRDIGVKSCEIGKRIHDYQVNLQNVERHVSSASRIIVSAVAFFSAHPVVSIALYVLAGLGDSKDLFIAAQLLCFFVLPGLSVVMGVIFGIIWREKATKRERAAMRSSIQKAIEYENYEFHKAKAEEQQEYSVLTSKLEELEQSTKANTDIYKNEIEAYKTKFSTEIVPNCTSIAQTVKTSMVEMCGGLILEEDWENVDLLLFYIETGRADSLKEALQLVDRQRQTNQISQAIYQAGRYVANTLDYRFTSLETVVQRGFVGLASIIQSNHNETINTLQNSFSDLQDTINTGNLRMSQKLDEIHAAMETEVERIVNAERLNAALLKKANESSDELMNELRYNQKYWINSVR